MTRVTADNLTDSALEDAQFFVILGDLILPISTDRETIIGRNNAACDIAIADSRVSKMHASIYQSGERFFIKDLGSLNGTQVNGEAVEETLALVNGDTITLPPYKMVFANSQHPRIVNMRQARASAPAPDTTGSHFAGQLKILCITDLIQLLNATKQSGILTIRYGEDQSASVFFHTGEILQARYREYFGEEAVYQILNLREGGFEFVKCAPPIPSEPLRKPTLSLLLDGCRLIDESLSRRPDATDEEGPGEQTLRFPPDASSPRLEKAGSS